MSKMIRTPHFRAYCEKIYIWAGKTTHAMSEAQARDKFNEALYDDFNTLTHIVDSLFPNSRRDGEDYLFITGDIEHTHIGSKITENVGRCTLKIDERAQPHFTFENEKFIHGHLYGTQPSCWGGYVPFSENVCKIGFSGALMDMYNFACYSAYSTTFPVAGLQERVHYGVGKAGNLAG